MTPLEPTTPTLEPEGPSAIAIPPRGATLESVEDPLRPPVDKPDGPDAPDDAAAESGGPVPREALFRAHPGESSQEIDRRWLDTHAAAADAPHLSARSVGTGLLFGAVLGLSNLYLGLKVGWANTVAITACILSYSGWRAAHAAGLARSNISIHEQNCMAATASAAGLSTGAALYAAIPALLLSTGQLPHPLWLFGWIVGGALLGTSLSLPWKRALVHYEELPFPSGQATAQMLHSLHAQGEKLYTGTRALLGAMIASAFYTFGASNTFGWWSWPAFPTLWSAPGSWFGRPLAAYTVGVDLSCLSLAVGAILGLRISAWMLFGSTFSFVVAAPWLQARGLLSGIGYREILTSYSLWLGVSIMVSASLTELLLERGVLARAWRQSAAAFRRPMPAADDALADVEIPSRWQLGGVAAGTALIVVVAQFGFGVPWWQTVVAVFLAACLVLVALRSAGETDITPAGDLGRLAQLCFGVVAAGQVVPSLLMSSVVSASAASAGGFTERLKVSYLLGSRPRQVFIAQLIGIVVGGAFLIPAFFLLVPDPSVLGTPEFPAPAAQSTRAVAELLSGGIDALSALGRSAFLIGAIVGIVLAVLGRSVTRSRAWLPSAMGLGMGMVLDVSMSSSFALGALAAYALRKSLGARAAKRELPVSAGLIAGESLMGVLLALLTAVGWMALD
ncbi:MAG TPA: OPT family oligopeptide transporter [Candidatus Krumholzibacteria bacterium]